MKRRLVLAIAAVAGAAVLLFALPLAVVLQRSYRDEELLRLQRDTDAATRGIDLTKGGPDRIELPRFAGQIGIYSVAGFRVAGDGPARANGTTRSALRARRPSASSGHGPLVVSVPLLSGERITGAVRAERNQGNLTSRTHRAWLALAGLVAGVVALAVLAALTLGRRLSRPLERLALVARRVGEGDFTVRAEATSIKEIDDVSMALNTSSRRVDELVSRERSFSADASHQLRTPLAALRLELETAALASPERAAELRTALAQVDRLQTTIETLLAVSRGTSTGEARTDLVPVLRALEARWRGPLAQEGRRLDATVEDRPAVAAIPAAVLEEITEVLLQNAKVHGRGAVSVIARRVGDALALEVSDHGPGFPSGSEDAFRRGSGSGHGSGHGIGLALARSLAHAEGARLQITEPGPHPTVSLFLPAA